MVHCVFSDFGLKTPIHAPFGGGGFGRIFPPKCHSSP